jgi:hypothetical protein
MVMDCEMLCKGRKFLIREPSLPLCVRERGVPEGRGGYQLKAIFDKKIFNKKAVSYGAGLLFSVKIF